MSDKDIAVFARRLTDRIEANSGKIVITVLALSAFVAVVGSIA